MPPSQNAQDARTASAQARPPVAAKARACAPRGRGVGPSGSPRNGPAGLAPDPARQRLPLGRVLRGPVLAPTVPIATAGLLGERVDQKHALKRRSRYHKTLDPIAVAERLLLVVDLATGRQRFQMGVAATTRVTHHTTRVPGPPAQQDRLHLVPVEIEIEPRGRRVDPPGQRSPLRVALRRPVVVLVFVMVVPIPGYGPGQMPRIVTRF